MKKCSSEGGVKKKKGALHHLSGKSKSQATIQYHDTPEKLAYVKRETSNPSTTCGEKGSPYLLLTSPKIKNSASSEPSILLLGIYPNEPKTLLRKNYVHCSIIPNRQNLEITS